MRRVTQFIPSSLETCVPPLEGPYVCAPDNHMARGRVRPVRASNGGGAHVCAPQPYPPHCHGLPSAARACPSAARAPPPCAPSAMCTPTAVRATLSLASHEACAPPIRAHGSRSRPTLCAPLQYKFIKIVVHSTTWASRPSTTMRWMIARCLGGDHSFLIHFHGPRAHPRMRLYACLI
jgi:hypothetical protein